MYSPRPHPIAGSRFIPLVATALALGSSPAWAAYNNPGIQTTDSLAMGFAVPAGQTFRVYTDGLSAGADPVLHLWNGYTRQELAMNDDGAGIGVNSDVSWTNTTGASQIITVYLRSYSNSTQGTATLHYADLWSPGQFVAVPGAPVGGTLVQVPAGAPGAAVEYHAVPQPGGCNDPMIFGYNAAGHMVAFDDDGGVAAASRISGVDGISWIGVQPYDGRPNGQVNVYANDVWSDADGDQVGASLESELGLCWQQPCTYNLRDSDRDGLSDGEELFGYDDTSFPQELPVWGADPRRKDLFLEVDYASSFGVQPITAAHVAQIDAFFAQALSQEVMNIGMDGIAVHADIGEAAQPGDETLYGQWGGSDAVPDVEFATDWGSVADAHRSAVRSGLFRHVLLTPTGSGQSGVPADRVTAVLNMAALTHELGHSVGLQHWGHDSWGGAANCKPNYHSMMNYLYTYDGSGFSHGSNVVLDPAAALETAGVGGDATYLRNPPFYLDIFGQNQDEVDWNRNNQIDTSPVRAPVTWGTGYSCGALMINYQPLLTHEIPEGAPSLARVGTDLYAFWIGADHYLRYRVGQVALNDAHGSCPGGDTIGQTCMNWGATNRVNVTARGVSALGYNNKLIISYRGLDDRMRVADFTPVGAVLGAPSGTRILEPTGSEPELGVMRVDPARYGASEIITLMYRDGMTNQYKWYTRAGTGAGWVWRHAMKTPRGTVLTGLQSPSIAHMGAGNQMETCGAFTKTDGNVHLYCFDVPMNGWLEQSAAFTNLPTPANRMKPGFAYHVPRDANGAPVTGDPTAGQFWLVTMPEASWNGVSYYNPKLYIGADTSSSFPPRQYAGFERYGAISDEWRHVPFGSGFELYEDDQLTALKMLYPFEPYNDPGNTELDFVPLGDGAFHSALLSGNDFEVMERNLCMGLRNETWCGDASTTAWHY